MCKKLIELYKIWFTYLYGFLNATVLKQLSSKAI